MNIPSRRPTGLCTRVCATSVMLSALLTACTTGPQTPAKDLAPPPAPAASAASAPEVGTSVAITTPVPPSGDVVTTRLAQRPPNNAVLSYADRARTMAPAELAQEINRLGDLPDGIRSPFEELQLAIALSQTRNAADLNRAIGATQRVLGKTSDEATALHPMARLLGTRYAEQKRLEDLLDRQTQALRDSQRRSDVLNERLEAMRALERSLNARPRNGSSPHQAMPPTP